MPTVKNRTEGDNKRLLKRRECGNHWVAEEEQKEYVNGFRQSEDQNPWSEIRGQQQENQENSQVID